MHLIHEYGLLAVAAIIGLECLGLPVPVANGTKA